MDRIRILMVDDQALVREGFRRILESHEDLEVVAVAPGGREAVRMALELRPEVVLMDIRMPEIDGIEATRQILAARPSTRIVALTTFDDDAYIMEILKAGAAAYLLKDASEAELIAAIHSVRSGDTVFAPRVAGKIVRLLGAQFARGPAHDPGTEDLIYEPLSPRELDVLRLLAEGRSNQEIADGVNLAEGTVRNMVSRIYGKLGARDRVHAILKARDRGLVP